MRTPHPRGAAGAVAAAVLAAALFAGDSVWTALGALAVAGAWGAPAFAGRVDVRRARVAPLAALLALAVWTGLSVAWSIAPDRTWAELDRTLVYAAFLALGILVGDARRAVRVLAVALGAAIVWALAGKAIPALFEDGGRAARLRDPIGYWNALSLAADVLLVLALHLAVEARSRLARSAGASLAFAATVAVLLTASRAGLAAAVLGIGLWLWLRRDRVEAALLALAATVPGVAVGAWAFTRPALVEDGATRADRVADGAVFGVLVLAGAVLAALATDRLPPLEGGARRRVRRALAGLGAAAALAAVLLLAVNAGRVVDEFAGEEVANDPGRIKNFSSNNRSAWWGEAWEVFRADPLAGAGANTFEVAHKRYRDLAWSVTQPHSVPLQFLAGTGIVGLLLFAALVAAVAAAAIGAVRSGGDERAAAAALAVALALWLLHALVDYPWDFVAVTGPALFAAGALAAAGRELVFLKHKLLSAAAAAVALAAAFAVVTPWLAERSLGDVNPALERGDLDAAAAAADRARALDPLSLEPLFAQARVAAVRKDAEAERAAHVEAVRLQPENPEAWLQLGLLEYDRGDWCAAYRDLNRAYTLDPAGLQWSPGGPFDETKDWVNAGRCG